MYHSENCLSQARLVALQLSFTATKQVINLDAKAVMFEVYGRTTFY